MTTGREPLPLASFKLRYVDEHVRAVPLRDRHGRPFAGPGVDLRGDDARRALEAAAPVHAWLAAREPGVVLRSLSIDLGRARVLVTLETGGRPRVLRFDPPHADELVAAAHEAARVVGEACARALERREISSSPRRA